MNIKGREKLAIKAARVVGRILLDNLGKQIKVKSKGDRSLVTDIDKKAEKAIIKLIQKHYPEDGILSEESPNFPSGSCPVRKSFSNRAGFSWIIDPIDGTHNFIHNIEVFGVSLALEFKGKVVLGVIYMPCTDELYIARKEKGAYCNGKGITVSKRNLKEATLIFDSSVRLNKKQMLSNLGVLVDQVFNVRMFGSTVRSLTYLAEGKVETEIEFNDKVWDFAAGLLLVEEAGGKATDFQGRQWSIESQGYIASNGVVHKDILKIIKRGLKNRR